MGCDGENGVRDTTWVDGWMERRTERDERTVDARKVVGGWMDGEESKVYRLADGWED